MRIPGLKLAKHAAKWLHNRIFPGAMILGYHRIVSEENDSFHNCVSPNHFEQHMEVLRRYANPISLDELIYSLETNEALNKIVCVTIDDGYIETLNNARPILETYNIPTTAFITSGNLGKEFWWDRLGRYLHSIPEDANLLRLRVDEQLLEWDFANLKPATKTNHIVSIANYLRPLSEINRNILMNEIKIWADINDEINLPKTRCMTSQELIALAAGDLINIGSHSVTHPILSNITEFERRFEMEESKRVLEGIIDRPITGFSYPNGRYLDSDPDLVYQSGYRYACTSKNGTVRTINHRFMLPRFWMGDLDGKSFHRWLRHWL